MTDLRDADRTLPMSVANMGFMLDRLGQDCAPLQFLRELTKNSIDAIQELPESEGSIAWDVEWTRHTLTAIYKLCIVDTGTGMTGEDMVKYINNLSSSGRVQSYDSNFGVGAKIAAATRNHAGLLYLSWKDGRGAMIHLWRNPDSGVYGLRQFEKPDGSFSHWVAVSDDVKPPQIEDHGTMVVLLGKDDDADTMTAPVGAPSPSRWVTYYLNTRFFKFPSGVTIKAREGWEHPRTNTDSNILRTITGQAPYLERQAQASGQLALTGGVARWWILKDDNALSQNSGNLASAGHAAALYGDELYEMVTGRAGTARLQNFGVIFGSQRVVIYIEPQPSTERRLTSNTARTHLLINAAPLPWAEWAHEFRAQMPEEINALMEEIVSGSQPGDHRSAIRERLKQVRDLFRLSRYRPSPSGAHTVDASKLLVGGNQKNDPADEPRNTTRRGSSHGGSQAGNIYALFLDEDGVPADEVVGNADPEVTWITAEEGTRTPPDLEDKAARYLHDQNRLLINGDFRAFTDFIERWTERYADVPGAREVVKETVREWFEQTLIETVIGTRALRGSREWDIEELKSALNEPALTAAVMPRYHIEMAVKRILGQRLGSLKERVS